MLSHRRCRVNRCWFGIVWLLGFALASTPTEAQEKMYFSVAGTEPRTIRRADLDGANAEVVWSGQTGEAAGTLALDLTSNMIYWSDPATLEIKRATLFGQSVEVLVTGARSWGLALDTANGMMYWNNDVTKLRPPGVYRSALDGTSAELVIPMTLIGPNAVAVDSVNGKLYWSQRMSVSPLTGTIHRADLDGTNAEVLMEITPGHKAAALALDVADNRLYWAEPVDFMGGFGGSIKRSRLDGTEVETLFEPVKADGLALDLPRGHVYWISSDHTIQRSNLDGSDRVVMDLGVTNLRGIAIDTRPAVKVPAASTWGLVALTLAIGVAGTILLLRRRFG